MTFKEIYELISEIRINPNNSFEWFVMTPNEAKKFKINYKAFKSVFYCKIREYLYIISFDDENILSFWNHSVLDFDKLNTLVFSSDLNLLDNKEILKLIATIFSIIEYLVFKKGELFFKIDLPEGLNHQRRKEIYIRLFRDNIENFLKGFELSEEDNFLILKNHKGIIENKRQINKKYIL
jgi:hypothetical protein